MPSQLVKYNITCQQNSGSSDCKSFEVKNSNRLNPETETIKKITKYENNLFLLCQGSF